MQFVDSIIYTKYWDNILDQFKTIHPGDWEYQIINIPNTHLKLIDLIDKIQNTIRFRVLLNASLEDVQRIKEYPKNYREISWLQQAKGVKYQISEAAALQVCIIQLDTNYIPSDDLLFTFSDGIFHLIPKKYIE